MKCPTVTRHSFGKTEKANSNRLKRARRIAQIAAERDLSFDQVETILEHGLKALKQCSKLFPKGNKRFRKDGFKKLVKKVNRAIQQNQG